MAVEFQFQLTRAHLEECFDESLPYSKHQKPKYGFAGAFIGIGMGLIVFTEMEGVAPYLMVGLGVLEFVSFYYRRPWWLARQMWSRSANATVTITLDDDGVHSKNPFTESCLKWEDIAELISTEKGVIFKTAKGQQSYLSKANLTTEARAFITQQLAVYKIEATL